jgi:hypothetical protein
MTLLLFCFSACFPLPPWTKLVASARLCFQIWLALVQAHIFALPLQRACSTKTSTTSRFDLCHPRTTCPQHNPSPSSNSNARQLDEQQPEWLEAKENPQAESLPEARLAPMEARSSRATLARLVSRLVLHIPQPAPLQPQFLLPLHYLASAKDSDPRNATSFNPAKSRRQEPSPATVSLVRNAHIMHKHPHPHL